MLRRFRLAYRGRWGRQDAEVEASTLESAETLGREWCLKQGHKYLAVSDAVVAREEAPKAVVIGKAS